MFRFLHLADVHLGTKPLYLGSLAGDRSRDFLDAFQRAVDFAVSPSNKIDAVVIAGDFFDTAIPSEDVLRFAVAQLKKLRARKIPVLLVPGNHDNVSVPGSVYAAPASEIRTEVCFPSSPQVTHLTTLYADDQVVHFYGMAWDVYHSKPPYDRFKAVDEPGHHVVILHGTILGSKFADAYSREVPLQASELSGSGMDYIALGHLHSFQQIHAGRIPVVYPGSLEGKRFAPSEEGDRYLVAVTLEEGKSPLIETEIWNRRKLENKQLNLDHEGVENDEELANLIRARFADRSKLFHLELTGIPDFVIDIENLKTRLSGEFYWFDVQDHTEVLGSQLIEAWKDEETIRGLFVRKLQEKLLNADSEEQKATIELTMKLAVQAFQKSMAR